MMLRHFGSKSAVSHRQPPFLLAAPPSPEALVVSLALDQWIFQFEKRDLVRMQVFVRIHGPGQPIVRTQFVWRLDDLKTSSQDLDSSTVLVAREICCESSSYGVACQSLRQVSIMDVILDRKVRFSPAQRGRSASLKVESDQLLSTVPFRLQAEGYRVLPQRGSKVERVSCSHRG